METELITQIRKYINDTTEPYDFSDEEIEYIYTNTANSNMWLTIAEIWLQKAISISDTNEAKSYSIGNESYSFEKSTYDTYMEKYNFFLNKANNSTGQFYERTANTEDSDEYDYSELMGGKYDSEFS